MRPSGGGRHLRGSTFSKRLLAVPIAVLGQATGQASPPFFARLFNEKKLKEFAVTVNDSVYRVSAASLLATAWMMAAALCRWIDSGLSAWRVLLRRHADRAAIYFFWFSLSLAAVVGAGALCARVLCRGRYADADGGSHCVITAASLPVYSISVSYVRSCRPGVGV